MAPHALSSGDTFTTDVLLVARHVIHGMVCLSTPYLGHPFPPHLLLPVRLVFVVARLHMLSFMSSSGSCVNFFSLPFVLFTFSFWLSGVACSKFYDAAMQTKAYSFKDSRSTLLYTFLNL